MVHTKTLFLYYFVIELGKRKNNLQWKITTLFLLFCSCTWLKKYQQHRKMSLKIVVFSSLYFYLCSCCLCLFFIHLMWTSFVVQCLKALIWSYSMCAGASAVWRATNNNTKYIYVMKKMFCNIKVLKLQRKFFW